MLGASPVYVIYRQEKRLRLPTANASIAIMIEHSCSILDPSSPIQQLAFISTSLTTRSPLNYFLSALTATQWICLDALSKPFHPFRL